MPDETEIKLKIRDPKAFQRILKRLGAKPVGSSTGRVHEENLIFDTPDGGLAKHGQLLRLRTETVTGRSAQKSTKTKKSRKASPAKAAKSPVPTHQILTFKRPTAQQAAAPTSRYPSFGSHKVRDEIEAQVTDSGNLVKIFEGLGMRGWFRYEKYRTTYKLPAWSTRMPSGTPPGLFSSPNRRPLLTCPPVAKS